MTPDKTAPISWPENCPPSFSRRCADSLCTQWTVQSRKQRAAGGMRNIVTERFARWQVVQHRGWAVLFFIGREQRLGGWLTPTHKYFSLQTNIYVRRCFCIAATQKGNMRKCRGRKHRAFFFISVFHALGTRHTRSNRNLAKWDKIIKLQGTLLSFPTKWMKWCQHVTASPSGCENTDATINSSSYSATRHWILPLRRGWIERAYKMVKKKNPKKPSGNIVARNIVDTLMFSWSRACWAPRLEWRPVAFFMTGVLFFTTRWWYILNQEEIKKSELINW